MYNYIERDHFANALQKYNIFCTYANPLSVIKRKRTIMEADFLVLDGVFCKETKRAPLTSRPASVQQRETLMLGFLQEDLQVDNKTKVPIIFRYKVSEDLPTRILAFHEAMSRTQTDCDAIVHFYEYDFLFMRLFRNPDKYVPKLKQYRYVLSPDMSQYIDMPYYRRYANNCDNKAMAQYLQRKGVNIIANVAWSLPDSYDYCFAGIPKNMVIAINSNGVNANCDSKYLWHKGYEEAIRRLKPTRIIRYGQKMPDEREDISIYFDNTYIRRMRHGSKR